MEKKKNAAVEVLKKVLKFILFFGVGVFFVWISIRKLSPEDVTHLKESARQVTKGSAWVFLFLAFLVGGFQTISVPYDSGSCCSLSVTRRAAAWSSTP